MARENKDQIPEWALKVAEDKRWGDNFSYKMKIFNEPLREMGEDIKDPEPPELQTEEDVLAFAKKIAEEFDSLEDYKASLPKKDTTTLEKLLEKLEKKYQINEDQQTSEDQ